MKAETLKLDNNNRNIPLNLHTNQHIVYLLIL